MKGVLNHERKKEGAEWPMPNEVRRGVFLTVEKEKNCKERTWGREEKTKVVPRGSGHLPKGSISNRKKGTDFGQKGERSQLKVEPQKRNLFRKGGSKIGRHRAASYRGLKGENLAGGKRPKIKKRRRGGKKKPILFVRRTGRAESCLGRKDRAKGPYGVSNHRGTQQGEKKTGDIKGVPYHKTNQKKKPAKAGEKNPYLLPNQPGKKRNANGEVYPP